MRRVFTDAYCRQVPPPVTNHQLWLTRVSEYRTALIHAKAFGKCFLDTEKLLVTVRTDHDLYLLVLILKVLAAKSTPVFRRINIDFCRSRSRFRAGDVQSLFITYLLECCLFPVWRLAPILPCNFGPHPSPFTVVSINSSSIQSTPFTQFFAFLQTGKLESISFPSLLPPPESYIDCSSVISRFNFPHLETVQIKGQFSPSSAVKLLQASPLIYQVELFQRKETTARLVAQPRGPNTLSNLRCLSGTATHVLHVVCRLCVPLLRQMQILPHNCSPTNRMIGTYCKRVNMCLMHARPTTLSLILPKPSTRNLKLTNLNASSVDQVLHLSIGGLHHYPYHISHISVQY